MGVKTKIDIKDLIPHFSVSKLIETSDGISHTVYILDDNYILKIYEKEGNHFNLDDEQKLLEFCNKLKVPKVLKRLKIKGKEAFIFNKAKGVSLKKVDSSHLKQIANFLKVFHSLTKNSTFNSKQSFDKNILKEYINQSSNSFFQNWFNSLEIELKNDGIIHGDLFLDNALFYEGKLSCVFDFSDACNGDFLFDLAVVALSWCNTKSEIEVLINEYDEKLILDEFLVYVKYASLYYCVRRYLANKEFEDINYFKKFETIL